MRTASHPRLHVEDRGDGEPVLLITGWTISSAVLDPVAERYAAHVRCVSYDHRGSGRSAPWPGPVSMAMLAADAARVLDERGIGAAHVAGASMGGMVALELALRMPHRVRSLILLGTGAGQPAPTPAILRDRLEVSARLVRDSVVGGRPSPAAALFSPAFRAAHPERVRELVRPFLRHRPPPWTVWAQSVAAACFDRVDDLRRITAPALVVHGERDLLVPLDAARVLAAGIPDARLHVVPGAGHAAPLEVPDEVAEVVLAFVGEHAGRPVPEPPGAWGRHRERATRPLALHTGALRLAVRAARPSSWRAPRA